MSRYIAGSLWSRYPCDAAASFFDQLNSVPSIHMRCRITASLRATATLALRSPLRLASLMGDTDGDATELQRMVAEGEASIARSDEPVKGAMEAMFAWDGL